MTTYTDYSRIMKFDKSRYNEIKRDIFHLVHELGTGRTHPVPYDTAWVARIPKLDSPTSPAFPDCLQWLRDNQSEDGSWGTDIPLSLHSKTLNTFAGVLALSQWNYPEDTERKQRGLNALKRLEQSLPQKKTNDAIFEMILVGFLDDARELKLDIPHDVFDWFVQIGKEKRLSIETKVISDKPNKYWAYLEASCRTLDLELESFRSEITQYGLIAAQPSSTAYVLRYARLIGKNFPEAEWALAKLCAENKGGIPHISPCDNFEIVHILDFLFKAGINPNMNSKYAVTNIALNKLKERLNCKNQIGISSSWPVINNECSAIALSVMERYAKIKPNFEDNSAITRGTKNKQESIFRFEPENIKNFFSLKNSNEAGVLSFVEKAFLKDKRNVSSYYNILQQVFGFQGHEIQTDEMTRFIGRRQNNDGGWGSQGKSTLEETAYVCLALFRLVQKAPETLKHVNLTKILDFMNSTNSDSSRENFWRFKVNFRSAVLSKAVITAAKFVLLEMQRLLLMTVAFNENQLEYLDLDMFESNGQPLCRVNLLLTYPETERHEVEKQEVMDICKRILEVESFDAHMQSFVDICLECNYFSLPTKLSPYYRAVAVLNIVAIYLGDDIYDFYLRGKNDRKKESNEFLDVWCKILRGDYINFEAIPALNFPRFPLLAKWLLHFQKLMEEKCWNAECFIKIFENYMLKSFALCYKLKHYSIESTPKRYLQIAKGDVGLIEVSYLNALLVTNTLDLTQFEDYKLFVRYRDCACKAVRVLTDVISALKDVSESKTENYCIQLQNKHKIPLGEAMVQAAQKGNKEVLKMFCFKKMIMEDPTYKNNNNMLLCMKYIEQCLAGFTRWAHGTPRYQGEWTVYSKRVTYGSRDSKFIWDTCFN